MNARLKKQIRSTEGQLAAFGLVAIGATVLAITLRQLREPMFEPWISERAATVDAATRERIAQLSIGNTIDPALLRDPEFGLACLDAIATGADQDPDWRVIRAVFAAHPEVTVRRLRRSLVSGSVAQRTACIERHRAVEPLLRTAGEPARRLFEENLAYVSARERRFGAEQAALAKRLIEQLEPNE